MTVREIAELAGVSIGTVDRVLNKRGRVSAETRARIEAIIERYQFTPNPIARQLKRGRAYRFCAVLPRRDQDAGFWRLAITGIEEGADSVRPLGVEIEIIEYDRYALSEARSAIDLALSKNPDGLLFTPNNFIRQALSKDERIPIPYVFFDADEPELAPLCRISQDPFQGGYLAGRLMRLFAGGTLAKPAAIIDTHKMDYNIIRRREGFLRYAEENGFPVVVQEYFREEELSVDAFLHFFRNHPGLSGIFVSNCVSSYQIARTLKDALPARDFFIIGYDLIPQTRQLLRDGFIDAIISQRIEEQGRLAVLALYRHIVLEEKVEPRIVMPLDIFMRENTPPERI